MKVEYKRLAASIVDAEAIVCRLKEIKTEYFPQEVRSLVRQYEWTVLFVMRMCNTILDEEPSDAYGKEIDDRIKVEKILYKYERIWDKIYKGDTK